MLFMWGRKRRGWLVTAGGGVLLLLLCGRRWGACGLCARTPTPPHRSIVRLPHRVQRPPSDLAVSHQLT